MFSIRVTDRERINHAMMFLRRFIRQSCCLVASGLLVCLAFVTLPVRAEDASAFELTVQDADGNQLPCRVHIWDAQDQPLRPEDQPFWHDHFVCSGRVVLRLPAGDYRYLIERGPEHERLSGRFTQAADDPQDLRLTMHRIARLRERGWYAADLHIHRPIDQIPLLVEAADLDVAPVITWWNIRNLWSNRPLPQSTWRRTDSGRLISLMAGEDEREGGALLYFGLDAPIDIRTANREYPSPLTYVTLAEAEREDVWIDIEKPFWWDVPVWLASGRMDSIGLANNHMCRDQMLEDEAWGKPRDVERLPAPRGNGMWSQEIYYHVLNTGIRLPPSAGSASGVLPNPVGYNRVYVHLDEPLSPTTWFDGLKRGACFVTNGPLLLCRANRLFPGAEISFGDAMTFDVQLDIELMTRDRVAALDIIHNGQVVRRLPIPAGLHHQLSAQVTFGEPGWFLIRAMTDNPRTFQFASTGPFYLVDPSHKPRISRRSVQFFQDWVHERMVRVRSHLQDPQQLTEVMTAHEQARTFWDQRAQQANAD